MKLELLNVISGVLLTEEFSTERFLKVMFELDSMLSGVPSGLKLSPYMLIWLELIISILGDVDVPDSIGVFPG